MCFWEEKGGRRKEKEPDSGDYAEYRSVPGSFMFSKTSFLLSPFSCILSPYVIILND
jgi:hypothetical protein